ncbi:MAG: nucleotidyltransferase domain-containing protein [Clostridia bacterium]|nr:nucleotidyltransferase domain-containing protein [Clostridia bacterium]
MPEGALPYASGKRGRILRDVVRKLQALPGLERIFLFGSYARGTQSEASDLDLALFFRDAKPCLLEEYRMAADICRNAELDIQAQVFHSAELEEPCGIVEEVLAYGIELFGPDGCGAEHAEIRRTADGRRFL